MFSIKICRNKITNSYRWKIKSNRWKLLKEALINENLDYIINLGLEQIEGGADILNVNVGLPDIDEKKMMPKVIKEMQSVMDVPLQVDSSNIEALEQGLRYYNGKTIANSVNGKEESLNAILPIVKNMEHV